MKVFFPPNPVPLLDTRRSVFLGGTIDNGNSIDWQKDVTNELSVIEGVVVCNPRRTDWDSKWSPTMDNPLFAEQVDWELNSLDQCSVLCFYFASKSLSPITLMELGIFSERHPDRCVVFCSNDFWRKGNVDKVCQDAGIPVFTDYRQFLEILILKTSSGTKKLNLVEVTWIESERGWAIRPDGYSYHLTSADMEDYVAAYNKTQPKEVPSIYSCPSNMIVPKIVSKDVTADEYCQLLTAKGLRR